VVVEEEVGIDGGDRQNAASTVATDRVESGGDLLSFGMKVKRHGAYYYL
jgi:hypothetical protein